MRTVVDHGGVSPMSHQCLPKPCLDDSCWPGCYVYARSICMEGTLLAPWRSSSIEPICTHATRTCEPRSSCGNRPRADTECGASHETELMTRAV